MGIFDRFPYSSTHEMNLDFMLGKATEIAESLQEIDTHKEQAEQAATNAAQSAASATEQYQSAHGAAIRAEVAQGNAENAATSAGDAADRAEAASDLADEAVEQAQAAATTAGTAAQNASTAADGAIASAAAAETRINTLAASLPEDFTQVNNLLNQVNSRALQQGHTTYVSSNNYSTLGITSVFAFGENKFYGIMSNITSAMIPGLPEYGHYATIVKFSPTGGNAFAQYLYTTYTDVNGGSVLNIYTACGTSSNTMTPWKRLINTYDGKSFDIIGDSYSSFIGWNPTGNETYFPEYSNTVKNVGQTWWYQLSKKMKMSLLVNDSYSGATVCTHVRPAQDESVAFINRVKSTMGAAQTTKPKPDIIFIFGGQNDQQVSAEIGTQMYSGWTAADLYKFAPAFCYLIDYLINWNPSAEIINITNSDLNTEITDAMAAACSHYGIKNIILQNIDKDNMHPTAAGMTQICTQVMAALV